MTVITLTLEENETTPWHCHPVPTLGYVLQGSLEVETKDGKKTVLQRGQPVVEVMKTLHRGHGLGGGAELVVFYAGARDVPTTVLASDAASARFCQVD